MKPSPSSTERYDVTVIGGGLAGTSTALLIRAQAPQARILVLERQRAFDRKVGEATVEVGGHFLDDVLGLGDLLRRDHLSKHGFGFWFHRDGADRLDQMAEVGNLGLPEVPSFLLDRQRLDEELLKRAAASGIEVLRPARVREARPGLEDGTLEYEADGITRTVCTRWIVDASGRRRWLGQKLGLHEDNEELQTTAMWARWRGVKDLDAPEVLAAHPRAVRKRGRCTNHFMTRGSWTWMIASSDGETSIGTVFDPRLFTPPRVGRAKETYVSFVRSLPGLRELLAEAEPVEGDFRSYRQLPYTTRRYAGAGYALVGDAATFFDPFYSPGIDHLAMSASATAALIADDLGGELTEARLLERIRVHDERFRRSARRWFEALYRDKYELFGDAELTAASFFVDTGAYYMGVVGPVLNEEQGLTRPTLGLELWQAGAAYRFLRFFRRRLVRLARKRMARGTYGRRNRDWQMLGPSFGPGGRRPSKAFWLGLRLWLGLELSELNPFRRSAQPVRDQAPERAAIPVKERA